jgi:hypothetical protein
MAREPRFLAGRSAAGIPGETPTRRRLIDRQRVADLSTRPCTWICSGHPAVCQRPEDEAAGSVLSYRLGMPARKRPTSQDAAAARRILLDGMARDTEVAGLVGELAPLHPRDNTFPGEIFLHVAADALDWCGASRAEPLALEGMPERFLPECAFRGRQNKKLQFAVLAAAALHGGAEPDLLEEVTWWQTDDFWQYALYAAVAYIRAAADRADVPMRQVCQELAQRVGPRPG